MSDSMDFFAFYSNPERLQVLIDGGIDGIVVDWERKGKELRQKLYDTQISVHHTADLKLVHQQNPNQIICRINPPNPESNTEIDLAIDHGADEILLPMVQTVQEVEKILTHTDGRIKVGLMLETEEALAIAADLDQLPVHRFFVGLNDLSIQRGTRNIFYPFLDGTLDELRPKITKQFGVAGLTHPQLGDPIPCKYLVNRMKYYQCSYAFLRRSFYRDLEHYTARDILLALSEIFGQEIDQKEWSEEVRSLFQQELI